MAAILASCTTSFNSGSDTVSGGPAPAPSPAVTSAPLGAVPTGSIGSGSVKVALILPMSAGGNAGSAAQAMRNAAEMAMSEFKGGNIQLIPKDDTGTAQGAQVAAQQAIEEGAEIILGPLFAQAVGSVKQVARARNVPVIAFSTDTNVASSGTYLLSFLPESDVDRAVAYAVSQGKRSFVAMIPSNAYGTVVEGEFKQVVGRRGGRVVALEHYAENKITDVAKQVAQSASRADVLFIPDSSEGAGNVVAALTSAGVNMKQFMLLGTQLWDDPRSPQNALLEGGLYAAPDPAGFRAFTERYRARYSVDPPHPAALSFDAVSLVAALVKTQGQGRFSSEVLTNPSGFTGIDGVFRFRPDGTNQRGLAMLRITPSGPQVASPPSRNFNGSAI